MGEVTPNSEKEMNICKKEEVRRTKRKRNNKDNKRKRHIFVLTGRFCNYFTHQALPVRQT
jgi:hypothetical protein